MKKSLLIPVFILLAALLLSTGSIPTVSAQIASFSPTQPAGEYRTVNYSNGDSYSGYFVNDKFNGTGQYIWANGDKYSGEFSDGQISGYGELAFINGDSWSGLFVNGQISDGKGTFYFGSNGDRFTGYWVNGQPNGSGTLIHANGSTEPANFQNGQAVNSGSYSAPKAENPFSGLSVGSVVYFGRYEQDNNYNNGSEPIQWRVLDIRNGKALLLSVYGLETMAYHYQSQSMTWENCSLRQYLNSNFYNGVFNDQERPFIAESYLSNNSSSHYGTYGGNATYDHVFLLSIDELRYYFPSEGSRKMQPTALARSHGAYGTADRNCAWWWLRSPGQATNCASSVNSIGVLLDTGPVVSDVTGAIRPAIWVNM